MIEVWPAKLITRFSQRFLAWLQEHVSIRHFVDPAACGAVVSGAVVGGAVVGGAVSAGAVSAAAQERDRHAAGSPGLGLALCHAVDLSVGRNQWRA